MVLVRISEGGIHVRGTVVVVVVLMAGTINSNDNSSTVFLVYVNPVI
jgi:hypothetical protein